MLWLLLDFFLHSFAILAITEGLCRMAGSLMPAARYRLRLTGLMLLLLSPLLAILVPDFGLSIFLRESWSSTISFETRVLQQGFTGSGFTASLWPAWLWLAGVVLSLAPLAVGYARICWIAKRATSVSHPECTRSLDDLKARLRLRASPQLLKTNQVVVPPVYGCWRKRIILPADCEEWPVLTKRSVLAHELAHLKRRDLERRRCSRLSLRLSGGSSPCWPSPGNVWGKIVNWLAICSSCSAECGLLITPATWCG